jgi:hypothetical protein
MRVSFPLFDNLNIPPPPSVRDSKKPVRKIQQLFALKTTRGGLYFLTNLQLSATGACWKFRRFLRLPNAPSSTAEPPCLKTNPRLKA